MLWKKDPKLKFTDLCKFIDKNIENLREPGKYPELEDKIYNYLWLIVKAIAIKKRLFKSFQDYDGYAFYAANRLFFAIRRNLENQGKVIKGKEIRPIVSCLNYMKAILYPMKVEYLRESFREVISEEFVSKKFDAFSYRERLKAEARNSQGVTKAFKRYILNSFNDCGELLDTVLSKSPFPPNSMDYTHLKISILINCLQALKVKNKLSADVQTVILWKLPKSMSNYVRILLKEFFSELKLRIMDCYCEADVDETTIEALLTNPLGETTNDEE